MRNAYGRNQSSNFGIPWKWVGILVGIALLIFISKNLLGGNGTTNANKPFFTVIPDTPATNAYIKMSESSKNKITGTGGEQLFVGDAGVSVESGTARASNTKSSIDIDQRTDMAYLSSSGTIDAISLGRGRIWIAQNAGSTLVEMKNAKVSVDAGQIAILEQNNEIYSTIYAIKGDIAISTSIGNYTLTAGNKLPISGTNLSNPATNFKSLVEGIDKSITETPIFTKNNGNELLSSIIVSTPTSSGATATGSATASGAGASGRYIDILDPKDGSIAQKSKISIQGTLLSKDIKRVTFNDKDASVSPVNETFVFPDFAITSEINNVVYKVYDATGNQLEKGVITIYGSKQALQSATTRLVPESSPISSKDFKIVSPTANPYVTTESAIKVQGTVPKDRVQYIVVNGYRLQKYVAGTTTWYYFANVDTDTLREGINSYSIKFFGPNDTLLYTQLFSIIKETKNATTSSTTSQ